MANAGWLDRLLGKDPDEVFSYTTKKHVIISDKMIAILSLILKGAVFVYIVIYVFMILRKFESRVQNTGYMYYKVEGKAFSRDTNGNRLAWDIGDFMFPEMDPTGPFIATRVYILRKQQIGTCGKDCVSDEDCPSHPPWHQGECMSNGQCNEMRWCPDIENSRNTKVEEVRLQGIRDIRFLIYSGIKFEQMDSDYFINEDKNPFQPYKDDRAIVYTVGDILGEGDVDLDAIARTGALINMEFWYSCNAKDSDCAPDIKYDRMDPANRMAPTISNRVVHYVENGVEYRDYYRYVGVKFYFVSRGKAFEFSLKDTMLQIASALGLLQLMTVITDFIMLNFYPENRRKHYRYFKVVESVNFTEKMHRIDVVRYMRDQEREKVKKRFEEEEEKKRQAEAQE